MYDVDSTTYRSKAFNRRVRFLVFHYTAINFEGSVNALAKGGQVSAHYLLPTPADPSYRRAGFDRVRIFNLVDESERAWHSGVSAWGGRSNLNDTAIGIELVNEATVSNGQFSFPEYHPEQIAALVQLSRDILQRYPDIKPTQVLGHSDIAIGRKSDPGAAFPWRSLHEAGIGAWYDEEVKTRFQAQFASDRPASEDIQGKLRAYGYSVPPRPSDGYMRSLLRAFQLHFRPSDHRGFADAETLAILYALAQRYQA
ncbi:N-acetylmuramoyl-L-alanine amidase [Pseudomonas putida]|uniref:N-acetylmuramoyl-L-alanine amidase n=1 Tax=Pseudomonas TaxID=286 RepID=UPI00105A53EA|nr:MULTISPECIES: N-acetylmuramoyl-L-alanine amidase [Pseudomonas]MBF8747424.1 N-acetylmuramoyl-L-alanine amidase [Pseudomonas monteilii]MCT8162939.1 N-acetylmuramoyl-L-alanine amidase [Pseudomonas sp. HD6422]MCT8181633.1 N-acetylmuramoyl-L-alanine amidase [Pseudomonas sp. HD6421]TDJ77793.1 N-acetylmuramoyl-L-alanine amidase [Pseudomonas putida]